MNNQFKNGDVVRLKSGGPKMTIRDYDTDLREYDCIWFESHDLKTGTFPGEVLEVAPEGSTQPVVRRG